MWVYLICLALLANVVLTCAAGCALWRRHRYLFRTIQQLKERLHDVQLRLRMEMREQDVLNRTDVQRDDAPRPRFTSQFGEDTVLYDYFRGRPSGYFVEAGAFDGVTISNTYLLESLGWRGLLVEANPIYAAQCEQNRPRSTVVNVAIGPGTATGQVEFTCLDERGAALSYLKASPEHKSLCDGLGAQASLVQVPYTSLNRLLDGETAAIDLLSLDLEGMELDALHGFDLQRYRPEIVIVEHGADVANTELANYLRGQDYFPEARTRANVFFIHQSKREAFRAVLSPEFRLNSSP